MRSLITVFALLTFACPTMAKVPKGSYINQYLRLTEQITPALQKLRKDVFVACDVVGFERKVKKGESQEDLATFKQNLRAQLPERVSFIRRKAQRLRELKETSPALKRSQGYIFQYSRHIDLALDALKQAAYSGRADVAKIDAAIESAKQNAAFAERGMGAYLDSKAVPQSGT